MTDSKNFENHAMIVAAGKGERSGLNIPKQYSIIKGKSMLRHSAEAFSNHGDIQKLWIVIAENQHDLAQKALDGLHGYELVIGGDSRQESVWRGLNAVAKAGGCKNILIHDAARPFLSSQIISELIDALDQASGVIPVLPTIDTIIKIEGNHVGPIVDRDTLWRVQTPQAFDFQKLYTAHKQWDPSKTATDDAQILRTSGHEVTVIDGDQALKKYTTISDFEEVSMTTGYQIRTGMGYDVHQLAAGEELWLGGIKIEHDKGLSGHSDADVVLHALTDALLGAIGGGDIGDHFPPTDPQWRGVASYKFVEYAVALIKEKSGQINNVDLTIICEAPKIKPHREAMRQEIAKMLSLNIDQINVKATTTEGLGFTGRKEGIAAQAIATVSLDISNPAKSG